MPDRRGNLTALRHAMLSPGDALQGEFCEILGLDNVFGDLASCGVDFQAFGSFNGIIEAFIRGIGPTKGFERDTVAWIDDHEGLVREVPAHCMRPRGGRIVWNLLNNIAGFQSEPNNNIPAAWTHTQAANVTCTDTAGNDADGNYVEYEVISTGGAWCNILFGATTDVPSSVGRDYRLTNKIKIISTSGSFNFVMGIREYDGGVAGTQTAPGDISGIPQNVAQRMSSSVATTVDAGTDTIRPFLGLSAFANDSITFRVYNIALYEVTGQSNQTPPEYVSVGVGTGSEQIADVTAWTTGAGWTDNGVDSISAATATSNCSKDLGLVANKTYVITYTATVTAGSFRTLIGGTAGSTRNSSGTYTDVVVCGSSNTNLTFDGVSSFTGSITGISIKEADHGAFVDGVRYYAETNTCEVDGDGVVTETAATTPITDWRFLFEPLSKNYTDDSDDLSGGAETVDLTAEGTGDFTLSVSGDAAVTVAAGTATGTGFGQATAGSPVTFNLSVTGTVTLTLDSGSLDTLSNGAAIKQVEPGAVATTFIATAGSPPVTRSADDPSGMFDYANWSQTEGTWYCDVWFSDFVAEAMGIFSIANNDDGVLYKASISQFRSSDDGGATSSAVNIASATVDNQYRVVSDFGTGSTLDAGYRDVEGAGNWTWDDVPENYDGAFVTDSVINIAYNLSKPIELRDLKGYKTRKGKDWVEANL